MSSGDSSWSMQTCERCGKTGKRRAGWNLCSPCFYATNNVEVLNHPCRLCGKQQVRPKHFQFCSTCFTKEKEGKTQIVPTTAELKLWVVQLIRCRPPAADCRWQGIGMATSSERIIELLMKQYATSFPNDTLQELQATQAMMTEKLLVCHDSCFLQILP